MKETVAIAALAALSIAAPISGQSPDSRSPNVPRTSDGKVDLSGIWMADPDPKGKPEGTEYEVKPPFFMDLTRYLDPKDFAMLPEAQKLYNERVASQGKLSTEAHCVPVGVPGINTFLFPFKIIQTQPLIVILYEKDTTYRQIFMDGRNLPQDPDPRYMGHSIGRWDGDTLAVESIGFIDRGFLDRIGHPYSDKLHLTERIQRSDFGHLSIEMTIDDPKTYRNPFKYTESYHLLADTDFYEFFCTQNEKDTIHFK